MGWQSVLGGGAERLTSSEVWSHISINTDHDLITTTPLGRHLGDVCMMH